MADKPPLKRIESGGDTVAVGEMAVGETVGLLHGGTGSTTASGARTNLGLGTAAVATIGTSGDTVPKNNTANVYTLAQDFSAAGAYFGGATADNLLDAYDKNLNWTPVVTVDTTGDLSIVYGVQVGRAQQVGNRVDFNLRVTMTTFTYTTASGQLHVSLPATAEGTANNISIVSLAISNWTAPAGYGSPAAQVSSSSAVIDLKRQPISGGSYINLSVTEITSGGGTITIHAAGSYEV